MANKSKYISFISVYFLCIIIFLRMILKPNELKLKPNDKPWEYKHIHASEFILKMAGILERKHSPEQILHFLIIFLCKCFALKMCNNYFRQETITLAREWGFCEYNYTEVNLTVCSCCRFRLNIQISNEKKTNFIVKSCEPCLRYRTMGRVWSNNAMCAAVHLVNWNLTWIYPRFQSGISRWRFGLETRSP